MANQDQDTQVAGKGPQNTPVEKLQQSEQPAAQRSDAQTAQGQDYVVDQQVAEMEASHGLPPQVASDPANPGVNDLGLGGSIWLAKAGAQAVQLHTQPGASATNTTLAPGVQATVIEGPNEQGGTTWLRVRTAEGKEGWVKSDELQH